VNETCGATYVANAGTAHIYGGELELSARLTTQLTLTSGTAYTHAYVVAALAGTGFTDGERVQEVPDWTNTTSLAYRQPFTDDYAMVLRATNVYIGTMTDVSFVLNQVPSHDLVNLRAGLISDRKVSVSLFLNNVTDKRANLGDPQEISFFVPTLNRVTTNQPRTIGVELNYAWGGQPRP
jgi:iron complex outermembrane receptor protein